MINATWPARMQRITDGVLIDRLGGIELWLDGGHNPAAGAALASTLAELPRKQTHLICGMINTKDVAGYLAPMAPQADALWAVTIPDEMNAVPAETIAKAAEKVGLKANMAHDLSSALEASQTQNKDARIVICGSLYLAGHVLRENGG